MLNSGPSSEKKRGPFRLNPFYLYPETCSTFNHNINKNTIQVIRKVVRWINSLSNRGVRITNQKGTNGGFLGYVKKWFQPNGLGNILPFREVEKLFVIT